MLRPSQARRTAPAAALVLSLMLCACAERPRLPPIPERLIGAATVPGFNAIRSWGEAIDHPGAQPAIDRGALAEHPRAREGRPGDPLNVLAISGGGANGSFAAGLLVGWTKTGSRPRFDVVTGVSVGALAAPFAFLGPEYDRVLAEVFTSLAGEQIIRRKNRVLAFFGDSLASPEPLKELIARNLDEAMMHAIAAEHRSGRRLFVATAHVYAGRQMIWDLGAIAASGRPNALALIHRVLLASASVPILLPPVYIEVEANGALYNEMHVDGGIMRQVFIGPPELDWARLAHARGAGLRETNFFVIRNGRAISEYMVMAPEVIGLADHAMHQLAQSLGIGDLYIIYLHAQREHAKFHAAWIGDDFSAPSADWYDPGYVRALFDYGYAYGSRPNPWHSNPPGMR